MIRILARLSPQSAPTEASGATLASAVNKAAYALLGRPGRAVAHHDRVRDRPDDFVWHWSGGVTLYVHRIRERSGAESRRPGRLSRLFRITPEVDDRLDELATEYGNRTRALEAAVLGHPRKK